MAKEQILTKDQFFQNIFHCALGNFAEIETNMHITGIISQVFGINDFEYNYTELPELASNKLLAQQNFMNHPIWHPFDKTYEYAVNGIANTYSIDELNECVDFSHILNSDHFQIHSRSHEIITMALVRYALENESTVNFFDLGNTNYPQAIAKLANIDVRTLKNAISANEIEMLSKGILSASSLKQWLLGRKGFKPTIYQKDKSLNYFFNSPNTFAQVIATVREELGEKFDPKELILLTKQENIIKELESGIFNLPLQCIPILSKIYHIPHPILLKQILKTFYPKEYALLAE